MGITAGRQHSDAAPTLAVKSSRKKPRGGIQAPTLAVDSRILQSPPPKLNTAIKADLPIEVNFLQSCRQRKQAPCQRLRPCQQSRMSSIRSGRPGIADKPDAKVSSSRASRRVSRKRNPVRTQRSACSVSAGSCGRPNRTPRTRWQFQNSSSEIAVPTITVPKSQHQKSPSSESPFRKQSVSNSRRFQNTRCLTQEHILRTAREMSSNIPARKFCRAARLLKISPALLPTGPRNPAALGYLIPNEYAITRFCAEKNRQLRSSARRAAHCRQPN
jgi:hypothetical protein